MKTLIGFFSCIVGFVQMTSAAPPVEWPIASGGNGHFFEAVYVPDGISWTDASDADGSGFDQDRTKRKMSISPFRGLGKQGVLDEPGTSD